MLSISYLVIWWIKFIRIIDESREIKVGNSDILYSVLIPAYNAEAYLEECLDSVLAQTHRNLQVVVIDDGSTDRTAEILNRYAAEDNRLEVVHRENRGVATTRLELFKMAKGKYINFVDADDTVEPEMARVMIDVLERTNADVAVCDSTTDMQLCAALISTDKITLEIINGRQARVEFLEHKRLVGALWNKVIRHDVCKDVTCPPEIKYGEDAVIFWHILCRVTSLVYVVAPLYHYRPNPQSVSRIGFNIAKMTGLQAWSFITNDVKLSCPELYALSLAQRCHQAVGLLYDMNISGNFKSIYAKKLRNAIKLNLSYFNKNHNQVSSYFRYFWCNCAVKCFPLARLVARLRGWWFHI